ASWPPARTTRPTISRWPAAGQCREAPGLARRRDRNRRPRADGRGRPEAALADPASGRKRRLGLAARRGWFNVAGRWRGRSSFDRLRMRLFLLGMSRKPILMLSLSKHERRIRRRDDVMENAAA